MFKMEEHRHPGAKARKQTTFKFKNSKFLSSLRNQFFDISDAV